MTVIAWDGTTLAADRRATDAGLPRTATKIVRSSRGCLVGMCGESAISRLMLEWFERGAPQESFPRQAADKDCPAKLVIVWLDGKIDVYEHTSAPIRFLDPFMAWGSGRDFAIAAMALGKTAREAVELACRFNIDCGNGVDELRHKV